MDSETYEGIVKDGVICLLKDVVIADNTRVIVTIINRRPRPEVHISSPRLVHREQAKDFEKLVIEDDTADE